MTGSFIAKGGSQLHRFMISTFKGSNRSSTITNESHCNFKCHSSGLNINPHYLHLGDSSDALIECTCCVGEGIVEIKCPFSGREYCPDQPNKLKNSFLDANGLLNRSHRHFTQVQGQLMITGRDYCHFVVWTPWEFMYREYTRRYLSQRNWQESSQTFM